MENQTPTSLPEIIMQGGFKYVLVHRTKKKCFYKQTKGEKTYGYEVFLTKIVPNHYKDVEGNKEKYPGSEEFGKRAWYMVDFTKAQERYDKL